MAPPPRARIGRSPHTRPTIVTQSPPSADGAPSGWPSALLAEALALLLTLLASVVLVVLLVFLPRMFLLDSRFTTDPQPLAYLDYVRQYLAALLRGDLGRTANGLVVARYLLPAARRSLELLAVTLLAALPLGLAWGALLALARRRLLAVLFGLNTLALSLPSFVVLLLSMELVAEITMRTGVRLAYVQGYGLDQHLVLPAGVLALRGAAFLARVVQSAHDDILGQEWIRAARARGLGGWRLWRRHVLPALRLPLLGGTLGMLRVVVGALVIVDLMCGWGGLGRQMLNVGSTGLVGPAEDQVMAGAAIALVLFFVSVDALGRWLLRAADPRLRGITLES